MPTPDPSKEVVFLASPTMGGRGNLIASPFQFLMTGEDLLVVTGWSDDATITLAVHGRFLKDTGEIQPFVFRCPTLATVAGQLTALPLGKGFLLNLSLVIDGASSVPWGRAYGRVDVVRGTVGPRINMGSLLAGYVTSGTILAWPGSPIVNPWEGAGFLEWRDVNQGGATNSQSLTAGTIVRWEIQGVRCVFQTGAAAIARRPQIGVSDLTGPVAWMFLPNMIAANSQLTCYWLPGLAGLEGRDRAEAVGGLPSPLWVLPQQTLTVSADNVQIADTVTGARALLRQFLSIP